MLERDARLICLRAVSLFTALVESTDWTAPAMWREARRVERADDRAFYSGASRLPARSAAEREGRLVLSALDAHHCTMATLYGTRAPHRDAILIGTVHRDTIAALGIDRDELARACEVLSDARVTA